MSKITTLGQSLRQDTICLWSLDQRLVTSGVAIFSNWCHNWAIFRDNTRWMLLLTHSRRHFLLIYAPRNSFCGKWNNSRQSIVICIGQKTEKSSDKANDINWSGLDKMTNGRSESLKAKKIRHSDQTQERQFMELECLARENSCSRSWHRELLFPAPHIHSNTGKTFFTTFFFSFFSSWHFHMSRKPFFTLEL